MSAAREGDDPVALVHPQAAPDAHGEAALLLAESILHALVEAAVLSAGDALAVVTTTCEVQGEVADVTDEPEGRVQASLVLLRRIARSLQSDVG